MNLFGIEPNPALKLEFALHEHISDQYDLYSMFYEGVDSYLKLHSLINYKILKEKESG